MSYLEGHGTSKHPTIGAEIITKTILRSICGIVYQNNTRSLGQWRVDLVLE